MSYATREHIKSALIVILLISAILLIWMSGMFTSLVGALVASPDPDSVIPVGSTVGTVSAESARPRMIVITDSDGMREVALYNSSERNALYDRTSSIIGEALGFASKIQSITQSQWRRALALPGVMYEYYVPVPLGVVCGWLGASSMEITEIRRLCLTYGDTGATLYFQCGDNFYRADTDSISDIAAIPSAADEYRLYEFERDPNSPAPYAILSDGYMHATAGVTNPLDSNSAISELLLTLGIDSRQDAGYVESDGTRNYVTNTFTLTVSPHGLVVYRRSGAAVSELTGRISDSAAIEAARLAAAVMLDARSGESDVYFSGISNDVANQTVTFDYFFGGGRVFLSGADHAAQISFVNGTITEMTLLFRSFSVSDDMAILPEAHALAARGGEFALGYSDSGTGVATPFWYVPSTDPGGAH